jgi:midasin (ATPase involved in ribosome maturation)
MNRRKRKGIAPALEYESFHGLVVNALAEELNTAGRGRKRHIFNTRHVDLAVEVGGRLSRLYEVKSSADLHALYTGTGQLMLNSPHTTGITRTLILPRGELSRSMRTRLAALSIETLEYRIKELTVRFSA